VIDPAAASGLLGFIVDRVNVGIVVVDPAMTVVVFNHFLEAHSRKRSDEVVGRNLFDVFPDIPQPWLTRKIRNVCLLKNFAFTSWQQRPYLFRFAHHRTITSSIDFMRQDCTFIPVIDGTGAVTHVCIVVDDATDTCIAHGELERARKAADSANEAKSEFLATMSHEIRTPLSGVIGMNQFLLETPLSTEQRALAQTVNNCATTLLSLLNDILDFSKIAAGKLEFESRPFSVRETLEGAVDLVAAMAHQKGLAIALTIAPDVPPRLIGDEGRLRQILLNLLNNAIKFTSAGSIAVGVVRDDDLDGDPRVRVSVRDTGIGIPADRLDRLFKSFSQVDASTTRQHGGTGLGLAISKRLAEMMGGEVAVESSAGIGSTFSFTVQLPEAKAAEPDAEHTPRVPILAARGVESHPAPATIADFGVGRRILVAEDNPVNQRIAAKLVAKLGFDVDTAINGVEAVEAIARGRYDAVLMDGEMPEMDGFDATRQIRRREATLHTRVPIIAMTASAMVGDRDRFIDAGMDEYITKPISLERLRDVLLAAVQPAS
jgi:signal transduction histidine kinase/ActR/RegA family two-component response regulator